MDYFEQQELEVEVENTEQEDSTKKEKWTVIVCQYKETSTSPPCGTTYIRKGSSTMQYLIYVLNIIFVRFVKYLFDPFWSTK